MYSEDIYVGYRYYEAVELDVLFPFGHGLSYTTFDISNLQISKDDDTGILKVSCSVTNTGSVAGAEVVQMYISQRNPSIRRPEKELKGFGKMFLEPGETRDVTIETEIKYTVSFWDEAKKMWVMERDTYEVLVGNTSELSGNALRGSFDVNKTGWWKGL